jgi:hypothetical protein
MSTLQNVYVKGNLSVASGNISVADGKITVFGGGISKVEKTIQLWQSEDFDGTSLSITNNHCILTITSISNVTLTLPDVATNSGLMLLILKTGATGLITINTSGSDTINDGIQTSQIITHQYDRFQIVSNGSVTIPIWVII